LIGVNFLSSAERSYSQVLWDWFNVNGFNPQVALHLDALSLVFIFVITFVGFLIHLYSAEFMIDDEGYARFFTYLNLFVGSMLILVLADNLVLMYLGWEGVGLCSYLLIGFWYEEQKNGYAARKAFIVTRVGDTAMAIGLFMLFRTFGTLHIQTILSQAPDVWEVGSEAAVAVGLLLLGGAVGKSAQLPLQTWLPDAMAGPSPVSALIHAATMAVNAGAGVLYLVKNYTGDVLNFETAAELAAAEGVEVASVVIDDDVAVQDSLYTAGRRGVGGTVLIEKIVGAAAERGDDLAACAELARRVNSQVRSMGMALTSCVVPHVGRPTFELGDDEMEIGIGIHGEPGRERLPVEAADQIVARLLEPILADLPFTEGDRTLLFVNGMGGTPLIELYLAYGIAERFLAERGIQVHRRLVGNYITSLEMQGMSITLLRLDDELISLWDAPVHTPALRWGV